MEITKKFLLEERQPESSNISYDVKKKGTKGNLEIIANVSNQKSSQITKVVRQFALIDAEYKSVKKMRETLAAKVVSTFDGVFDEADKLYSRVIVTASYTAKVAKQQELKEKPIMDMDGFLKKIAENSDFSLEALLALKEQFTKLPSEITGIPHEKTIKKPRITTYKTENLKINENAFDSMKNSVKLFLDKTVQVFQNMFIKKIDVNLKEMANMMKNAGITVDINQEMRTAELEASKVK